MKLKILLIPVFLAFFSYCFAQNITPDKIERSQEILKEEEKLRKRIEQPQKVFVEEIILPQGFAISSDELNQINLSFANKWLSFEEIQELLDILTQTYQKTNPNEKLPQFTYTIDKTKLKIEFEKQ